MVDFGTQSSAFSLPRYPAAKRPYGGHEIVIALSPLRNVARFSTKPNFSTPGGMKRFSLRISVNTRTPVGLFTVAFMFASKNLPPSTRKRSSNMNIVYGASRKNEAPYIPSFFRFSVRNEPISSNCFQVLGGASG